MAGKRMGGFGPGTSWSLPSNGGATRILGAFWFRLSAAPGNTFDHVERDWNQANGNARRRQHSANDHCAKDAPRNSPSPVGKPERQRAENKREGSHQDWPQAETGTCQGRLDQRLALLIFQPGKLDDENGVLGRQPDQHYQADLSKNIIDHLS